MTGKRSNVFKNQGARRDTDQMPNAHAVFYECEKKAGSHGWMGTEVSCVLELGRGECHCQLSVTVVLGPGPVTTCNIVTTSRPTPVQSVTAVSH